MIILNTLSFFNSVAVLCPQLPEPINGHINCSSEEPTFGTFCIFSCHEGHQLEDHSNEIVICNYNGSWSREVAVCQGKQRIMTGMQISHLADEVRKTFYGLFFNLFVFSVDPDLSASLFKATEVTLGVSGTISVSGLSLALWILKRLRRKGQSNSHLSL